MFDLKAFDSEWARVCDAHEDLWHRAFRDATGKYRDRLITGATMGASVCAATAVLAASDPLISAQFAPPSKR